MRNCVDSGVASGLDVLETPPLTAADSLKTGTRELAVGRSSHLQTEEMSTDAGLNFRAVAGAWHTVHIQGRREKTFAGLMRRAGIFVYLPLHVVRRRVRRREAGRRHTFVTVESVEPFFKNYAFMAGGDNEWYAAKATNLIYGLEVVKNPRRLVEGMERVQNILGFQPTARASQQGEKVGRWCEVVQGHPLAGCRGIVSERNGKFYIPVFIFNREVETEIEPEFLESI